MGVEMREASPPQLSGQSKSLIEESLSRSALRLKRLVQISFAHVAARLEKPGPKKPDRMMKKHGPAFFPHLYFVRQFFKRDPLGRRRKRSVPGSDISDWRPHLRNARMHFRLCRLT